MILFHGSNVKVENPQIIISGRALDFGSGFYTTSDEKQAEKWAKSQTNRRRIGKPTVSVYDYNEQAEGVKILQFNSPNAEWLDYVAANRKGEYRGKKYDIVIGPVADEGTMRIVNDYVEGIIPKDTAIILLMPQILSDQYTFLTAKGLASIKFKEVRYYD